jgi:hypothetical protein
MIIFVQVELPDFLAQYTMATEIVQYKIAVAPSDVEKLNRKLTDSSLPDGESDGWDRGTPVQDIRRIATYWHNSFKWSSFEERLNQLPNYEATISLGCFSTFKLHFVLQKSPVEDAIPLLFIHGCKLWVIHYIQIRNTDYHYVRGLEVSMK